MFIYNAKDGDSYPFLVPTFLWTLKICLPYQNPFQSLGFILMIYYNGIVKQQDQLIIWLNNFICISYFFSFGKDLVRWNDYV